MLSHLNIRNFYLSFTENGIGRENTIRYIDSFVRNISNLK